MCVPFVWLFISDFLVDCLPMQGAGDSIGALCFARRRLRPMAEVGERRVLYRGISHTSSIPDAAVWKRTTGPPALIEIGYFIGFPLLFLKAYHQAHGLLREKRHALRLLIDRRRR